MERTRCAYCRNPIKPHQTSVPEDGDQLVHEDCWPLWQSRGREPVDEVVDDLQHEYERRIAAEGLAGLLSPYVCVLPTQRHRQPSLVS
ncbi:hypothetical protein [Nocardioides mesophilus]|uniref:Uncharacterized protein n=1 Tax=Nocardioides mesophilus TaxID=433659 RepID=A0A7G9R6V4_9ACTN|nr:hypothetical protein [Nocardioides mesophilus]QNN51329.1 hypothetical protein H9L09_11940 [Nocardioides mesophilus]